MRIHFINVGYGEAILVESNKFTVLIDGGTGRPEEYEGPGCITATEYLKRQGIRQIDLVIVTHIHDDHIGGIPNVIRSFSVKQVWINVKPGKPKLDLVERFESVVGGSLSSILFRNALASYVELLDECERRGIPVVQKGEEGGFLAPAAGFSIQLLTPKKELQNEMLESYRMLNSETDPRKAEALFRAIDQAGNRSSISLRIKAGKTAVLLSGDKVDGWEDICEKHGDTLKSQILKLTHHGQQDGMPQAMVAVSQPENFVICSSTDRRFNSAHPEVIERAYTYLKENRKNGGVYITGCLQYDPAGDAEDGKELCAVWFDCDEETGQITVRYSKGKGGSV